MNITLFPGGSGVGVSGVFPWSVTVSSDKDIAKQNSVRE